MILGRREQSGEERTVAPDVVLEFPVGREAQCAADHEQDIWLPCCPAQPKSATGAGDAFAAALAWSFLEGEDLIGSARAANAAAAIAVEGEKTINPDMSADAVQRRMQEQEEFNHE